jgi:hypothetical protein
MPPGQKIILETSTQAVTKPKISRKLQSITYEGYIQTASGERIRAFTYKIEVTWKEGGGSTVKAAPIKFESNSNPASQKVIDDFRGRIPDVDKPEWIMKNINQDIDV